MELVYLWVEEYKNIHRQGFNFSPRFECEFKAEYEKNEYGQEKLKENCELKITPKDYVSIFPENINVTAIVGENGSGKSSIVELLFLIVYFQHQQLSNNFTLTKSFEFQNLNTNMFLIVYSEKTNFEKLYLRDIIAGTIAKEDKVLSETIKILRTFVNPNKTDLDNILPLGEINFYSIYFNYTLDTWDSTTLSWIEKLYHRRDDYNDTPLLLVPDKIDGQIDLKNISYLNMQRMYRFYSELFDKTENIKNYFVPNSIYIQLSKEKIKKKIENHINKISSSDDEVKELSKKWIKYLNNIIDDKDIISINKVYLLFKILEDKMKEVDIKKTINSLCAMRYLSKNLKNKDPKEYVDNLPIDNISSLRSLFSEKIQDCINFHNSMNHNIQLQDKYNELLNKKNNLLFAFEVYGGLIPWVNVVFFDDNKNYNSLSTGEKSLLNFLINMLYQIHNIYNNNQHDGINLYFDEVELTLHPQWQKRFLTDAVNFLQLFPNKKFNLFFATHSPFILSDIPKENVIFLENGEQKYPFKDNEQTFGANIHTLLSHGFFMQDGLMGEFAKEKINEIIEFHKQAEEENTKETKDFTDLKAKYEDKKTQFWHIQKIVGEDYLKQVIKNHLIEIEKILLGKDEAKKEEIKRLKARIELLEK